MLPKFQMNFAFDGVIGCFYLQIGIDIAAVRILIQFPSIDAVRRVAYNLDTYRESMPGIKEHNG